MAKVKYNGKDALRIGYGEYSQEFQPKKTAEVPDRYLGVVLANPDMELLGDDAKPEKLTDKGEK